ncbi:phosphatase PAP2 family protein [Bordetella genomosp. 13]|uniref:phosphatase PAP2 family protein n=1 Tax=Bordetella genomosp. 13 TaxID=463040 RepID=UPI0016429544|nr:phosphatase PAP2 family protein [Bordetella genomosp. 13]
MLLLGMLFIVGYRATNQWAAARGTAAWSLHGAWDGWIPFVPWTLWPYLSLNLIFPCTFFAFHGVHALRRHAARIAAVQLASFGVFVLLPTVNVRPLPQPDGMTGVLYAQLRAFEQPFNMFPSLHAAVLVVTWRACLPALPGPAARLVWHGWCLLILVSTVLTWQHDLLDVVGGVALGLAALAVWPVHARRQGALRRDEA